MGRKQRGCRNQVLIHHTRLNNTMKSKVNIIGAGLAGVEAAWQLAEAGVLVSLFEMKPSKYSEAHKLEGFAELVCSNSLRSNDPANAVGLLKVEMRKLNSLIMEAADKTSVPAGKALAVDRIKFSEYITEKIKNHPNIEIINKEVLEIDNSKHTIIATGPLTSKDFSSEIEKLLGSEYLYFYDSVAPVVDADSIDFSKGFQASRYGYGGADYWNFPLDEAAYRNFLTEIAGAQKVTLHDFEKPQYFEGCLPIEVMAQRGPETLRYGPMKPFGLPDPATGKEPYAMIQLRQEDAQRSMYNMVGFQTRMTWPEQKRVFRQFPGFSSAEFLRLGVIHRNTYINSPQLLDEHFELKRRPRIFFAGQITGVEGYIESAATGQWVGLYLSHVIRGGQLPTPPSTTAFGSLIWHVANPNHRNFQPMNVNFGLMPIIKEKIPKKKRKGVMIARANIEFERYLNSLKGA